MGFDSSTGREAHGIVRLMRGSCQCGGVVISVQAIEPRGLKCYCTICRKLSGSAFAAALLTTEAALRVEQGAQLLSMYVSTPGNERRHCSVCHAHVYTQVPGRADVPLFVSAALFEPAELARVLFDHIFVAERPCWHTIGDAEPQFEGFAVSR